MCPSAENEFLPTRRTLLSRLKQWDDQESWREFFNAYWKLIYGVALRAGLSEAEAQDVVQETIISVARQIPQFKYDPRQGSFKSWLFLITHRRLSDHFRKKYRQLKVLPPRDGGSPEETAQVERVADPAPGLDRIWDEEWSRHVVDVALQRVKRQVDPKHFQIFDCYVRKEWTVDQVSKAFSVRSAQVYLIKHRLTALLARELEELEQRE